MNVIDPALIPIIAYILNCTFEPVDWIFERLTYGEKLLIGNQDNLNKIKEFVQNNLTK